MLILLFPMFLKLMAAGRFDLIGHRVLRATASLPSPAITPAPIKGCTLGLGVYRHEVRRLRVTQTNFPSVYFLFIQFIFCVLCF